MKNLKIKGTSECLSKCFSAETNLSTFMCPNECKRLCKATEDSFGLLKYYGLNSSEISFCENNKVKCLNAYKLSWDAEKLCLKIYSNSRVNDENDACRHYVWSILMAKDLGTDVAESILTAHEDNPQEPINEKAMDLANNRLGLIQYSKFKNKEITSEDILTSFKEQMKKDKFIMLKPRYRSQGGLP
ncbi:MAG: hypothetical protein J0M15_02970 [Deltaproteobacteria bacterium]|nr:hypothetical protein [Deltaproteobacteria bacterium]